MPDSKIYAAIDASKDSTESTKAIYKARLKRLMAVTGAKTIDSLAMRAKENLSIIEGLAEYENPRSRRNMITAVLAAFKHSQELMRRRGAVDAKAVWSEAHDVLKRDEEDAYSRNRPLNERQDANYVSIDDIEAKLAILMRSEDRHATLDRSMDVILMSFYAKLVPKRSDYGRLRVYRDTRDSEDPDENFIVVPTDATTQGLMVIQTHKTSSTHKEIIEVIGDEVLLELQESLRRHPRDFVFLGRGMKPMTNNAFSKFVMRRFQRMFGGRSAGTSLLRHAYVSERVDFNRSSVAERADIARRMGHTTALQEKVYKWVDRGPWSSLRDPSKTITTCQCKTTLAAV